MWYQVPDNTHSEIFYMAFFIKYTLIYINIPYEIINLNFFPLINTL